jgi:uncharacterized caspase-like protein/Flp pilus assembly protein TadD
MKRLLLAVTVLAGLLAWPGATAAQEGTRGFGKLKTDTAGPLGTRRALVIGITNYKNVVSLHWAAADAQAFAAFLRTRAGGSVEESNIRLLVDSAARKTPIVEGLTWLAGLSRPNDEAIIYFAGHGDVEAETGRDVGFLLAYDARTGRDYYPDGALKVNDLQDLIAGMVKRGARVLLITDACRSGTLVAGEATPSQATAALIMREWNNVVTLVSSGPTQLSQEGTRWGHGHGVFTYYLLQGLRGLANHDGDSVVTLQEVARFVEDSVDKATGGEQLPEQSGKMAGRIASWVPDLATAAAPAGERDSADAEPTDSSVLRAFAAFRNAVAAGALLEPAGANAWEIYQQLQTNPAAASVLSAVRTDLKIALQEDAQQVINDYLAGGSAQPGEKRLRDAATELARVSGLTEKTSPMAPQLGAKRLFLEGWALVQKGDFESALQRLRQSVALDPQAYTYNALGFAFLGFNQLDSARQAFTAARDRAPRRSFPVLGLGLVALDAGHAAQALALLDTAVAMSEPQAALQLARAMALLELGRRAEAKAAVRQAVGIEPRLSDEANLADAIPYSPGILARLPRLRALLR